MSQLKKEFAWERNGGNDGQEHIMKNSRQFNGYLIFECTTHENRYKFPCYGSPTNCFLHNNNKKKTSYKL